MVPMGTHGTATFMLDLPAVFETEGPWIIARFPHLDLASQGATREEAAQNLIEAAQLFVESCFERGVLDSVLKGCGFVPGHAGAPGGTDHLTVPVDLLAARNGPQSLAG
jgi:predicted RNase H-like HicB family nuclease